MYGCWLSVGVPASDMGGVWVRQRTDRNNDFEEWVEADSPWLFTPTPTKLPPTIDDDDAPANCTSPIRSGWTPQNLMGAFSLLRGQERHDSGR